MTLILTFIANGILKLSVVKGGLLVVVTITITYIVYVNQIQKKRYKILIEDMNPQKYIEETHRIYGNAWMDEKLNSLYNLDLAFGYMSLEDFQKSLEYLKLVRVENLPKRKNYPLKYYTALTISYSKLGDDAKALEAYRAGKNIRRENTESDKLLEILESYKTEMEKGFN